MNLPKDVRAVGETLEVREEALKLTYLKQQRCQRFEVAEKRGEELEWGQVLPP